MDVLNKATAWIYDCAKLNFFIILGILRGGVILGIGPAFIAGGMAVNDMSKHRVVSLKSYFKAYKSSFRLGNRVVLPILAVLAILLFGYSTFLETRLSYLYLVLLLYCTLILWIVVALNSYYDGIKEDLILLAVRYSICNMFMTTVLLLANLAIIYLVAFIPGLVPFFLLGSACIVNTYVCYTFFILNDKRLEEEN